MIWHGFVCFVQRLNNSCHITGCRVANVRRFKYKWSWIVPWCYKQTKVILVEIFVILLENLTIVHVTSCYETWSREFKYFRCNDKHKYGTF
jgi:hypothetical protein